MLKKTCPYCHRESFSSSDHGQWICPYCQKDISAVPAEPAGAKRADQQG